MGRTSVLVHRPDRFFIKLHSDLLELCEGDHCEALILGVLEEWTNSKLDSGKVPYIYMSYPQWQASLYFLYGRSTIMQALRRLEARGLIRKRPYRLYGKDTYQYWLHVELINARLQELPAREPVPVPSLENGCVPKQTRLKINAFGSDDVQNQTGDPFKIGLNIESGTQNSYSTQCEREVPCQKQAVPPVSAAMRARAAVFERSEEVTRTAPIAVSAQTSCKQEEILVASRLSASQARLKREAAQSLPAKQERKLAPAVEAILGAWDQIHAKRMPRVPENIQAATELARIEASAEDVRAIRDRLLAQQDGWWRARGVRLKDVLHHYDLAALGPLQQPVQARPEAVHYITLSDAEREEHKLQKKLQDQQRREALKIDREAFAKLPLQEQLAFLREKGFLS
ncbi:hypothetical protein EI42_03036 [Thermosporothrix hazakensis]|jgi:hypothetical protein|uniref:Uncharacterized protein n=1 Tax=Thermosporothrix hazakensis TaxID=644383 RepID=A0A326UA03_THEHA|nr:hypothetical protein [Thermosporothrix hazakensis]PZW29314.1 hypothetical protein EI42_03036 [Thermosporothrix hazakensis]GCE45335.1 hypothetical protein KTH_02040 [Thermosporothrix hazakensis]